MRIFLVAWVFEDLWLFKFRDIGVLSLPDIGGDEVVEISKRVNPGSLVIILSGVDEEEVSLGRANRYIQKGAISTDKVLDVLRNLK